MEEELREFAAEFYDLGIVKFGNYLTKSGISTPIYVDFRILISHPKVLQRISRAIWKLAENSSHEINQICGVPYGALPIATLISVESNLPMLICRKEVKDHGTKKLIEGKFEPEQHCIIIEDVVTTGGSILEVVDDLMREGLRVAEVFIILDREQGGHQNLANHGLQMTSLFTLTTLIEYLIKSDRVDKQVMIDITEYLKVNQIFSPKIVLGDELMSRLKLDYKTRASFSRNTMAKKLFLLMDRKRTNLCLAADLTDSKKILELAEIAGPHIAVLKLHIDIVDNFSQEFVARLRELAQKYDFLIMEDRKFGDIGHIVSLQYRRGMYRIAEWADIVTAHPVVGPGMIGGLKHVLHDITEIRGVFLIAEMSSEGTLTRGKYLSEAISLAKDVSLISGVVCQKNIFSDPGLIQLTPGIKLSQSADDLGQKYKMPEEVVNSGADLAVVGRGITEASDKLGFILQYKERIWEAYERRIGKLQQ